MNNKKKENLLREKGQLEKTIAVLQKRLKNVTAELNLDGELRTPYTAKAGYRLGGNDEQN
jgi:hypothetical protein